MVYFDKTYKMSVYFKIIFLHRIATNVSSKSSTDTLRVNLVLLRTGICYQMDTFTLSLNTVFCRVSIQLEFKMKKIILYFFI